MADRVLQIRLLKRKKAHDAALADPDETNLDINVENLTLAAERIIRTIGIAVVGHVVLDTLRQVLIAKAIKP
jgi:hypothetical protein